MKRYLYMFTLCAAVLIGFVLAFGSEILQSGVVLAASAYATIEQAGSALTQRTTLNFSGSGVTCTDDSVDSRTNCAISGGGGGGTVGGFVVQALAARGTTATFLTSSVAGDILVVPVGWNGGAATNATLTDSASTSYMRACQLTGDANENIAVFVGVVPATPGTITFTAVTPGGFTGVNPIELSSLTTTVDVCAVSASGSTNAPLTITTTMTGDTLIIGADGSCNGGITAFPVAFFGQAINGNDSGAVAFSAASLLNTLTARTYVVPANFNSCGQAAYVAVALEHP